MRYVTRFEQYTIYHTTKYNTLPINRFIFITVKIDYIKIIKQIISVCVSFYLCVKILNMGYIWSKDGYLFMVF